MPDHDQTLTGGLGNESFQPQPTPQPPPQPPSSQVEQTDQTLTGGIQATPNTPPEDGTLTGGYGGPVHADQTLTGGQAPGSPTSGPTDQTLTGGAQPGAVPTALEWKVGDLIDSRYEVLGEAGRGGMGVVYRIRHREWNVEMAVKTPLPAMIRNEASRARFYREAQAWVDLGMHPNIVQCWYVRELEGLPRVFADYLSGGSLKDWFKTGRIGPGEKNWGRIIDLIVQAADGLGFAHEAGMVHRDVKPGNMLMTAEGQLCVTDFGLVKVGHEEEANTFEQSVPDEMDQLPTAGGLTLTGSLMGTPEYGAPEQWAGASRVDGRSDVYALGIMLFELCCGRRPFDDGQQREPPHVLVGRHLTSAPPDPRTLRADVPEALGQVILRCLAKEPEQRTPSMTVLREELADAFQHIEGRAFARPRPKPAEARAAGLNNRAVSLWDLGQRDEAFSAWNEALALDPHHPEALYNRGLMQWRKAALSDFDIIQALQAIKEERPRAGLYLGQLQLETLDAPAAEVNLERALRDPDISKEGWVWRLLGNARMAQERFETAAEAYREGLKRLPSDPAAQTGLRLAESQTRHHGDQVLFENRTCRLTFEGRVGTVNALAMLPDGSGVLVDQGTETFSRWDLKEGKIVRTYFGHERGVTALAVDAQGKRILSGSEDSRIRLWNLASAQFDEDFYGQGHMGTVTSLAFMPDDQHAVSGGGDRSVRFWELEKGNALHTWWGHEKAVNSVVVSPDGESVVSAGTDGMMYRWQPGSGDSTVRWQPGPSNIQAVAFLPTDASRMMIAGSDGSLLMINSENGNLLQRYEGHRGTVYAVALTSDGRFAVSGGEDRTLRLWDLESGRCLKTFSNADGDGPEGPILKLVLSPDGQHAVSGAKENLGHPLRLWNLVWPTSKHSNAFSCGLVISRAQNQSQSLERADRFKELMNAAEACLKKDKDAGSAYLALREARSVPGFERDPSALKLNGILSEKLPRLGLAGCYPGAVWKSEHSSRIAQVRLSSDGRFALSTGQEDKSVRLWDAHKGELLPVLDEHKQWTAAVALSADDLLAVTGSFDCSVRMWSLAPEVKCIHTCLGHEAEVTVVAIAPDGRLAFSGSADRTVRVWRTETGEAVRIIPDLDEPAEFLASFPTGGMLVTGSRTGTISMWSLRSGKCLKDFAGHDGGLTALEVTSDGRWIVSSGEDRAIRIWNPDSGQMVRVLEDDRTRIHSLTLLGSGKLAISGTREASGSMLRLWDLEKGKCLKRFAQHPSGVSALASSSNALKLMTAGTDNRLRMFELDYELDPGANAAFSLNKEEPKAPSSPFGKLPKKKARKPDKKKDPFAF